MGIAKNPRMTNLPPSSCVLKPSIGSSATAADGAVVEIVNVEDAEVEPGVTAVGLKEQALSDGRAEHDSVTGLVNAPDCEPTVTE